MSDLTTLSKVKTYLGITGTDDDQLLESLIDASSSAIKKFCQSDIVAADYTEYHDGRGGRCLILRGRPINSIASIYDDLDRQYPPETLIDADDYTFKSESGLVIYTGGKFQDGIKNVKITYNAGYNTTPEDIDLGCRIQVASWYNRAKQRADGIGTENIGEYSARYAAEGIDEKVRQLIVPFRTVAL